MSNKFLILKSASVLWNTGFLKNEYKDEYQIEDEETSILFTPVVRVSEGLLRHVSFFGSYDKHIMTTIFDFVHKNLEEEDSRYNNIALTDGKDAIFIKRKTGIGDLFRFSRVLYPHEEEAIKMLAKQSKEVLSDIEYSTNLDDDKTIDQKLTSLNPIKFVGCTEREKKIKLFVFEKMLILATCSKDNKEAYYWYSGLIPKEQQSPKSDIKLSARDLVAKMYAYLNQGWTKEMDEFAESFLGADSEYREYLEELNQDKDAIS